MENLYGLLTRSEKSENQDTIRAQGVKALLSELYIQEGKDFWGDMSGWCTISSGNRCNFYMNLNYENAAYTIQKGRKISYSLPSYGVKGSDAISRDMKYVNQYLQKPDALKANAFIDYVFGTPYLEAGELQSIGSESQCRARMARELKLVSHRVENPELICRILERIWSAREQNSKTRILIVLENAENKSMDLLRQLYLLLPQRLRMATGFETNVAAGDLDVIMKKSLPIYIMTVDQSQVDRLTKEFLNQLGFPVEFVEVKVIDAYPCDKGRLELLRDYCSQVSDVMQECVSYAERKVMESKGMHYSSFRIYEDIIRRANTEDLYWWKNSKLSGLQQICDAFHDQKDLMEIPVVREEAETCFYLDILLHGGLAEEILNLIDDTDAPNRQQLLEFLRQDLHFGTVLDAMENYVSRRDGEETQLNEQHAQAMQEQQEKLLAEKKAELEQLAQDHARQKLALQQKHDEAIDQKNQELQQRVNENMGLQEKLKNAKQDTEEKKKEIKSLNSQISGLEKDVRARELDNANLNQQIDRLQDRLRKRGGDSSAGEGPTKGPKSNAALIFGILLGVVVVAAGGVIGYGWSKINRLQTDNKSLEQGQSELNGKLESALSENEGLESENKDLNDSITDLNSKIEEQSEALAELETKPSSEITEETEPEGADSDGSETYQGEKHLY